MEKQTPTHEYKCNLDIEHKGTIQGRYEGQGTDVSVIMKSVEGETHVLSGRTLKTLKRIT
jgi:hypothetical protein